MQPVIREDGKMKNRQSTTVPIFNKKKRIIVDKKVVIEQITERLHNSASPEKVFKVSNILLDTRFSVKDHVLVSRI